MKTRLVLQFPGGKQVELDEETSERAIEQASALGVSVEMYLRSLIKENYQKLLKTN